MDAKKKHKPTKVTKPYMKGAMTDNRVAGSALKLFLGTLAMMVAYVMVGVMMSWDSKVLSIVVNSIILLSAWMIFHQTGASAGADAVNQGEIMYARQEKGRPVEEWERRQCFHPFKGFLVGLLGCLPLVICSVLLAVTAQRQMSSLGTLPAWLTPFEARPEIGGALAYYHETGSMTLEAAMRFVVRMSVMPWVNMVGAKDKDAMLILERVTPLLNLIPGLVYGLGYMSGVEIRSTVHTSIAEGKRKARRKQKKEQRRRQQTRRGPEQLN